jgi:hypothetical protein
MRQYLAVVAVAAAALVPASTGATYSNPCAGTSQESVYLGHGWRLGCATGYTVAETSTHGFCGTFSDDRRTIAVAKRWRVTIAPCGARVRVCARRCTVAVVMDQGPCFDPPGCWDNGNRDLDLSRATATAIGRPGEWEAPALVRWKVVR